MARRKPLITHVDEALEMKVKQAADDAGLTTSTYIRLILEREHKGK